MPELPGWLISFFRKGNPTMKTEHESHEHAKHETHRMGVTPGLKDIKFDVHDPTKSEAHEHVPTLAELSKHAGELRTKLAVVHHDSAAAMNPIFAGLLLLIEQLIAFLMKGGK